MTVESTATTETTTPTSKHITLDAFLDTYKPIVSHFKSADDSFQSMVFEIDDQELSFIKMMHSLQPKQVWTVLEVDGNTIVSSGCHFVNRSGYMVTEVPADADHIEASEPIEQISFNLTITTKKSMGESKSISYIDELLDNHINDTLHEDFYLVSSETDIKCIAEMEEELVFFVNVSIDFYEDTSPSNGQLSESFLKCLDEDDEIISMSFTEHSRTKQ